MIITDEDKAVARKFLHDMVDMELPLLIEMLEKHLPVQWQVLAQMLTKGVEAEVLPEIDAKIDEMTKPGGV